MLILFLYDSFITVVMHTWVIWGWGAVSLSLNSAEMLSSYPDDESLFRSGQPGHYVHVRSCDSGGGGGSADSQHVFCLLSWFSDL